MIDKIETLITFCWESCREYKAKFVVKSNKKKKLQNSKTSIKGLLGSINEKTSIHKKNRVKLVYASEKVIQMCRICVKEVKQCLNDDNNLTRSSTTQQIVPKALKTFIVEDLFPSINDH